MFTGIVTDVGLVRSIESGGDTKISIETHYTTDSIDIGASIACDGACLTVVEKGADWFAVTASAATLACTTLGSWQIGRPVNLERPLRVGDELGGHIVSGHVDGSVEIVEMREEGDSIRFVFEAPEQLAAFVAPKGSVSLNGVSLTVNEVDGRRFGVNIIPHTRSVTTFDASKVGDQLNIEIDILARYVARLAEGVGAS